MRKGWAYKLHVTVLPMRAIEVGAALPKVIRCAQERPRYHAPQGLSRPLYNPQTMPQTHRERERHHEHHPLKAAAARAAA